MNQEKQEVEAVIQKATTQKNVTDELRDIMKEIAQAHDELSTRVAELEHQLATHQHGRDGQALFPLR